MHPTTELNIESRFAWDTRFTNLFNRCLKRYNSGDTDFENYYSNEDLAFLAEIGYKKREFFDFVEDNGDSGGTNPSLGTALLVAAVRRDYFKVVMNGQAGEGTVNPDDLPGRGEELGGYAWLPRIIVKARGKLTGTLDPDIMYGCGGDRAFLGGVDIHPADFLRAVWAADGDDQKILAYVNGEKS